MKKVCIVAYTLVVLVVGALLGQLNLPDSANALITDRLTEGDCSISATLGSPGPEVALLIYKPYKISNITKFGPRRVTVKLEK